MDKAQTKGVTIRGNSIVIGFTYQSKRFRESIKLPPTAANLPALGAKDQGGVTTTTIAGATSTTVAGATTTTNG